MSDAPRPRFYDAPPSPARQPGFEGKVDHAASHDASQERVTSHKADVPDPKLDLIFHATSLDDPVHMALPVSAFARLFMSRP